MVKIGLKNVVKNITNAVFPPNCRGCGAKGEFLCGRCKKYISENMKVRTTPGVFRSEYLGYRDEILGEMIEEAKYESVRGMLLDIAEVVARGYFSSKVGDSKIYLVPMPTNRQHVRERAMDHMDAICREIERLTEGRVKCVRLLKRASNTVQVGASEKLRKEQAKKAVKIDEKVFKKFKEEYSGEEVILIDDVWTTGASLTEAGKILREGGINSLMLLAITKNRPHRKPVIRHGEIG